MSRSLFAKLLRTYGTPPSGAEKRAFALKQQLKLASYAPVRLEALPQKPLYVIVIGAGFAGLSAAYHLMLNNHRVTVLEASHRAGGRVLSNRNDFAAGQVIEFGAELVGANHTTWVALAQQFGLSFNVVTDDLMFTKAKLREPLIIGGKKIDDKTAERLTHNLELAFQLLDDASGNVLAEKPWDSPDAEKLDKELLRKWFEKKIPELHLPPDESDLLLKALDAEFTNDNAVSWEKQSLLAVLSQIKAHGGSKDFGTFTEVYRCSAGNDILAGKLIEQIGAGNIKLNEPVINIKLNDHNVEVTTEYKKEVVAKSTAKVVTEPGHKIYTADYVVLATPPTVWHELTNDPGILNLRSQTGPAVKFMSAVTDRFWIKDEIAPSGLAGKVGMTWEGTDNQSELPGREFDLSCFAGGDFAVRILQESDRNAFYNKQLEWIFNGFNKAAKKRHFQSWPEVPYIKTGYSFPGEGEVCSKIKYLNQAYKKRLFFAGEHTCAGFWGFMEGALRSGKIAAENIRLEAEVFEQATE